MRRTIALLAAVLTVTLSAPPPARAVSLLSSTITITSPPPGQAEVGDTVRIAGTVTTTVGLLGREVDLERDTGSGFAVVDAITTPADGSWVFLLPTSSPGTATYRVSAPGNLVLAGAFTATFTVSVVARPVQHLPQPSPSTWEPLGQEDASWSACTPITYTVFSGPLRAYAVRLARKGIRQVQAATGFLFRYVAPATARRQRGSARLVISFASARALGRAPADAGGRGGYDNVGRTIISAEAVLDAGLLARVRHLRGQIPLKVLLHELGHAMGLGHVTNRADRMYPVISAFGPARYGAGDRLGLQAHGVDAAAPCAGRAGAEPVGRVVSDWDRVVLPQ